MAWTLLDSGVALFADGGSGHAYSYPAGAPDEGDLLVVGVNSDTVVSTPSGWTLAASAVTNQGAYVFVRLAGAGEADSVTITTSGSHNAAMSYRRYSGAASATPEQTATAQINGTTGVASPAVAPGALSGTGRLCLLYAMNHSATSGPVSPVPSAGYSVAADTGLQGSGAAAAEHLVLQRLDGSGSETPSVTWTDNGSNAFADRYGLFVAFTPTTATEVSGTAAAPLGALAAAATGAVTHPGTAAAPLGGLTAGAAGTAVHPGTAVAPLGALGAAAAGTAVHPGAGAAPLGGLTATAAGAVTHPGTLAAQLGGLTAAAASTAVHPGTLAAPLGALTATAAGTGIPPGSTPATAAATLGALTAAAAGEVEPGIGDGYRPAPDLVVHAWLRSLPDLTTSMVGAILPQDVSTWSATGYVQAVAITGGTPDPYTNLRRTWAQIDCWAVNPDSPLPPWYQAAQLAEKVLARAATGTGQQAQVDIGDNYSPARILTVRALGDPRRVPGDDGGYARVSFDAEIVWARTTRGT